MSWEPNVFAASVLSNLHQLQSSTQTGVGLLLPGRDVIGRCFQIYIDDQVQAQNEAGDIRVNTLSPSTSILDIYV